MANPEVMGWVERVTQQTLDGALPWKLANPTTYVWEAGAPRQARVILQRVIRAATNVRERALGPQTIYILQVVDPQKVQQGPSVSLLGADDQDLNKLLERLYSEVRNYVAHTDVDYLNSLLPPLPSSG